MTIADIIRKALMLMDEYSMHGGPSNDPDINAKMADYIDTAQKNLLTVRPIIRRYAVPLAPGVTEYEMPEDYKSPRALWEDGKRGGAGEWVGKTLIYAGGASSLTVEYNAYPADINAETPDTTSLEIDRDAQELIPYWVAAQQFVLNIDSNPKPLLDTYTAMLSALEPHKYVAKVVTL